MPSFNRKKCYKDWPAEFSSLNTPQNMDELIAKIRLELVEKVAGQIALNQAKDMLVQNYVQGLYIHDRVKEVARNLGLGIGAVHADDIDFKTGFLHFPDVTLSDEVIRRKLQKEFSHHFQLFALVNAMRKQLKALNAIHKSDKKYEGFYQGVNFVVPIKREALFVINTGKITDINWRHVKRALLQKLREQGYVTLPTKESALLDLLLQNETIPLLGVSGLGSLIPDTSELVQCLEFFSEWSVEKKASLVLAYLKEQSPDEKKKLLTLLKSEAPQLTVQLKTQVSLRPLYFAIAIADNDMAAVRSYVDKGENINTALLRLFEPEHKSTTLCWLNEHRDHLEKITVASLNKIIPYGKYQKKTIAETLISTKKGRQLLLENTLLQEVFFHSTMGNALSDSLQKARSEINPTGSLKNSWIFAKKHRTGFFKNSWTMELVQAIVYGDLKKAGAILTAHPDLVNILLTEKVSVTDYSGHRVQQMTAFQAALCTVNDECCEMLARYMSQGERVRQYQELFPDGYEHYYSTQTAFNFSQIMNAISESNDADIQQALSLKLPNGTDLWGKLEKFRADFTQHCRQEVVFNSKHLLKAFKLYDYNFFMDLNKRVLFWRQVVGYVQRFLPANIAMDFAQGLYSHTEARQSFNCEDGSGSIYPLTAFSGLGFEYGCDYRWGRRSGFLSLIKGDVAELGAYVELLRSDRPELEQNLEQNLESSHSNRCCAIM